MNKTILSLTCMMLLLLSNLATANTNNATDEPATCNLGLYGINNFVADGDDAIYYFNLDNSTYNTIPGYSRSASNLSSYGGTLFMVHKVNDDDFSTLVHYINLEDNVETFLAQLQSYPIYRSTITPDGSKILMTSKTYMSELNIATKNKTTLGQLTYPGETFKDGDMAYSQDGNILYFLTGKALYTLDKQTLVLTKIGDHNLSRASGIAIAPDGTIYVSSRVPGEVAKIHTLNQNTADATFVMDGPAHVNDLTFVNVDCDL